jgi:hypothetical protein
MSGHRNNVVVTAGHHVVGARIESRSLEELIFEATSSAIAKAGLAPGQVDSVVISGNDQLDGRIISCMVTAGAAAGVGKNITTMASAPEHAFAYAVLRLLSGQGRNVLVVGWSKPSESVSPEHAELVSADPFFVRPIGMNRVLAAALQASLDAPAPESSDSPFVAWPLTTNDCQGHADGVCAMVLEVRQEDDHRPGARVRGVGWAMDRYDLGDREDLVAGGLDAAMRQATRQAGSSFGAVDSIDAFAFGAPNERRVVERAVSTMGGADTVAHSSAAEENPDFAAGLFTIWRAVRRVTAADGPSTVRTAAAVATLGFAAQGSTVVLLSDAMEA